MASVRMFGESKEGILQHLLRVPSTVGDLATALKLSQTAVRAQLDSLEKDGFVRAQFVRAGRGRPKKVYNLTEAGREAFPRRYEVMLELVIRRLIDESGEDEARRLLGDAGRRFGEQYRPDLGRMKPLEKVTAITKVLNDMGFAASISIEDGRPVIVRHNCIFMSAARQHHELVCDSFDNEMMRALLGAPDVELATCMGEGKPACRNVLPITT